MRSTIETFPLPIQASAHIKKKWDGLQSRGNLLDYDRAKLLHSVWTRLNRSDEVLVTFLIQTLGEFPGKRCSAFVRLVHAYDQINSQETWQMVGGSPVTTLVRLSGNDQRKVLVKIRQTLRSTERETVSRETFRNIVLTTVGEAKYRKALTERRGKSVLRTELALLKKFLLTLIERHPEFRREVPQAVVKSLGLDLVSSH